uniref:Zf-AD domain-containing protein n=1 Tax=Caenorhabditis tropicalis TaxID=1561998 RepID=A0A1I7TMC3_9PELO
MVHKKFDNPTSTKESTFVDRTPHPAARNYLDEMAPINGFHEENAEAIRLRDAFREEVSKRMGGLLLKGQTMLDEYCPTCSVRFLFFNFSSTSLFQGILMEDRTGVRRCVTCELYQEKTSQIVAEVPLQDEDLKEAVDKSPNQEPSPVGKQNVPQKAVVPKVIPAAKRQKKTTERSKGNDYQDAIEAAKLAVLKKLEWATSNLNSTDDTNSTFDFLTVIQKSAETLQALQF